ncbi:protein of unknown function DUF218 [Chroococcidiopsis thermalis PCC 7203]|uniref:DUF218 domain-containing protein n=1 Tax=Chroococcidiopsis thermalis (strain PCC 7203) TaxID=251229 RepID=K9U7W8_CHRTP|nr:protein of unknown function DUF218 [Chroococcidiopsis thermalis PCC 7203]PSB42340.1 YdcF family protein [Cyanosarcina cf. burmensis CCALA 770]
MFLFLSKLLPLFLYPLGIACVLLVVGLVLLLWGKKTRGAAIAIALALIILLVGGNSWAARSFAQSLEWQHLPLNTVPTADAIVVLGGVTRTSTPPRPTVEVTEGGDRLLYAAYLYQQSKAPVIILSGGRIEWYGNDSAEATDMSALLKNMGVPESAIVQEPNSRNTYENAVNVRQILTQRGIRQILLVTSAMHMPRSLSIFKRLGIAAIPAPTDFQVSTQEFQELASSPEAKLLSLLPDASSLFLFTQTLKEYIGIVIYWLRGWL